MDIIMGDLREMLQRLRQDLQEPNIVVTSKEEHDQAQLAIIDSIREEQHQEYWFNVGNGDFLTIEGQETYAKGATGLPVDFISVLTEDLHMDIRLDPIQRWPLKHVPNNRYDYLQNVYTTNSYPRIWRFWDEQIWVLPKPNQDIHRVKFRYLRDLGVPSKRFDGTFWTFDDPTWGSSEIAKAWQFNVVGDVFTDVTGDANDDELADFLPLPAAVTSGSAFYLGFAIRPTSLLVKVAVAAVEATTYDLAWEHSAGNDTWGTLADVVDGTDSFKNQGDATVAFTDPGSLWKRDVVNSSELLFWIRARFLGAAPSVDAVLSQVSAVGNSSAWMNEAERLIRRRAAYLLTKDYLKDDRWQGYLQGALEARQDLRERQQEMHRQYQVQALF